MNDNLINEYINELDEKIRIFKLNDKLSVEKIMQNLNDYCEEYMANNNINVKYKNNVLIANLNDLITSINENNLSLIDSINDDVITSNSLPYLRPHELYYSQWSQILEKQERIKDKQNNVQTTDLYQCKKCNERKCSIIQIQTRSADEPMTVFVTCMNRNCGNKWRING